MAVNSGTISHLRAAFAQACPSNADLTALDNLLAEMREDKNTQIYQATVLAKWLLNGLEYDSWPVTKLTSGEDPV